MLTVIKILAALFISLFIYDTVMFISQNSEKLQNEDVKVELEPEVVETVPPPEEKKKVEDEDISPGVMLVFWILVIASFVLMRFRKTHKPPQSLQVDNLLKIRDDSCVFRYGQPQDRNRGFHAPPIEWEPSKSDIPELSYSAEQMQTLDCCTSHILDYSGNNKEKAKLTLASEGKKNIVIFDQFRNEFAGVVEVSNPSFTTSISSIANHNEISNPSFGTSISSILNHCKEMRSCQCGIEKFQERLEAVETSLKSTETVAEQWGQRIEQAEQELISLHQQMYTVLSRAEISSNRGDTIDNVIPNKIISFKQFTQSITEVTEPQDLILSGGDNEIQTKLSSEEPEPTQDWRDNLKTDVSRQIEEVKRILESPTGRRRNAPKSKKPAKSSSGGMSNLSCVDSKTKRDLLIKQEELRVTEKKAKKDSTQNRGRLTMRLGENVKKKSEEKRPFVRNLKNSKLDRNSKKPVKIFNTRGGAT